MTLAAGLLAAPVQAQDDTYASDGPQGIVTFDTISVRRDMMEADSLGNESHLREYQESPDGGLQARRKARPDAPSAIPHSMSPSPMDVEGVD